jgi:hypothetical protein
MLRYLPPLVSSLISTRGFDDLSIASSARRESPAIACSHGVHLVRPDWRRVATRDIQDRRALLRAAALWTPRVEDGASHPYPAPRRPAQRCG